MKILGTFLLLFVVCITVSAQSTTRSEVKKVTSPAKKTEVKVIPLPADDKDPVCFMKVKKGSLLTTRYKGKLYGFCSDHCKAVFLAKSGSAIEIVLRYAKYKSNSAFVIGQPGYFA